MLGVNAPQGIDTTMLVEVVEQNARALIGEESHLAVSNGNSNSNMRKKTSMRNIKGLVVQQVNEVRSSEDKLKYNLRVKNSTKKQNSSLIYGIPTEESIIQPLAMSSRNSDDEDTDSFALDDTEEVRERTDIKAESLLEIQRRTTDKKSGDKKHSRKKKNGSPATLTRDDSA